MLASPPDSGPRGPPFYMFSRIPYTFILIEMIRIVIGLLHFPLPSRDVSWPSQPSLCVCTSFPSQQLQKQYWPGSIHPPLAVLLKIVFNNCVYREPQDGRSWQEMNTSRTIPSGPRARTIHSHDWNTFSSNYGVKWDLLPNRSTMQINCTPITHFKLHLNNFTSESVQENREIALIKMTENHSRTDSQDAKASICVRLDWRIILREPRLLSLKPSPVAWTGETSDVRQNVFRDNQFNALRKNWHGFMRSDTSASEAVSACSAMCGVWKCSRVELRECQVLHVWQSLPRR